MHPEPKAAEHNHSKEESWESSCLLLQFDSRPCAGFHCLAARQAQKSTSISKQTFNSSIGDMKITRKKAAPTFEGPLHCTEVFWAKYCPKIRPRPWFQKLTALLQADQFYLIL